jgi:hypothetical protein
MGRGTTTARNYTCDNSSKGVLVLVSLLAAAFLTLLVAGLTSRRSRKKFLLADGAFRCRIRACGYTSSVWPRLSRWWSRPMLAVWIDDVLVVRRGPVFARLLPLRANVLPGGVYALAPCDVRRCGPSPIAVGLCVWDGSRMEVAADEQTRFALVGPYLAAAIHDLPQAPVRRTQN